MYIQRLISPGPADAGAQPNRSFNKQPPGPVFPAPDEYRDPLLRTQAGPWPTRTVVHVWVSRGDSLPSSMYVHSGQHAHDFGSAVLSSAQRVSSGPITPGETAHTTGQ